jgi:hypothetical protein
MPILLHANSKKNKNKKVALALHKEFLLKPDTTTAEPSMVITTVVKYSRTAYINASWMQTDCKVTFQTEDLDKM